MHGRAWVHAAFEQHFALVYVTHAGGYALVHDQVTNLPARVAGLCGAAHCRLDIRRIVEQVRAEPCKARIRLECSRAYHLRAIGALTDVCRIPRFDAHGRIGRCLFTYVQASPVTVHPEVHAQHPGRIEMNEHVLADRFDLFDSLSGQLIDVTAVVEDEPLDRVSGQLAAEHPRYPVNRIAFRHSSRSASGIDNSERSRLRAAPVQEVT